MHGEILHLVMNEAICLHIPESLNLGRQSGVQDSDDLKAVEALIKLMIR
jgi:hypothetical protein